MAQLTIKKNKKDWHVLEFTSPITENAFVNDDFIIRGTAINETTTHNGHKYIAEELEKAGQGLVDKPLLVDHTNTIESIKGKVIDSFFDQETRSIKFEAKVMDKEIRSMIKDGRISSVSIGAFAEDLVKDEDGSLIAKGIKMGELSLVAVPADDQATFATAIKDNYALKEKYLTSERGYGEMTDDLMQDLEVKNKKLTENGKALKEKFETDTKELKEELKELKDEKRKSITKEYKLLCTDKKISEKDVSSVSNETLNMLIEQLKEIKVKEVSEKEIKEVPKMKSEVTETKEIEGIDKFIVEHSELGGYATWAMPDMEKWSKLHSSKLNGS